MCLNIKDMKKLLLSLTFLSLFFFFASPASASSFSDTFTDSDGTTLQIHNGLWDCNFNSEAIIQSNRAITSGINFQQCLANSFQDGSVSAILNFPGSNSDNNSAVFLRYIDSNNFYQCNLNASDGYVIFKMYQGNFSVLQNIAGSPGAGNHTILCYITGSTITLSVDGTQRAQTTDTDLPNPGRAGIGLNPNIAVDDYNSIDTTPNSPPSINTIPNETINEGETYSVSGSFTDPDSTSWTATVNYGDGSGVQPLTLSGTNFSLSHVYKDSGTYTVTASITDNQGAAGSETATITANNVSPTVDAITASTNTVRVNTEVATSANFTDSGILDTHTAVWNWGDSTTSSGVVTENNGSGSVSNNHTYTAAGIYPITLTVTDNDGGQGSSTFQYLAVYDPNAGFLTGSGLFNSPAGAYIPNPSAAGQFKFNIQAKYNANNTTPSGKINLDFKTANFSFDSTSFQWLVINGNKAQLKGTGTINGSGNYTIFISVLDGAKKSGTDKIRIKITDSSNNVIYDNQAGDPETDDPTAPITKGSLKIHH